MDKRAPIFVTSEGREYTGARLSPSVASDQSMTSLFHNLGSVQPKYMEIFLPRGILVKNVSIRILCFEVEMGRTTTAI